jgi:amidase
VWSTWGELVQPEITTSMPAVMRAAIRTLGLLSARQSSMNRGWLRGGRGDRRRYFRALERRDAFAAAFDRFLESYDAWLLPTVAVPAFPHTKTGTPIDVDGRRVPYMLAGSAFTCIASLTGHPAVTVPGALSSGGLPIGLQLIGRRWDDLRLVALAGLLARLTGGFRRPPGFEPA